MKQVLVIGASGFIGRRVVSALARSDWAVPIAGIHRATRLDHADIKQVRLDATDRPSMTYALGTADAVVNCLAGDASTIVASADVLFTAAARMQLPPLIVHLSSMAVYGSTCGDVSEDAPLRGDLGPYSSAKVQAEAIAARYGNAIILRPGIVYGPESEQWSGRIARWLFAHRVGDLGAAGDGYCNLVHVDDAVAAILSSLQRPEAAGAAFNLTMPDPPTWNEYLVDYALALRAVPVQRIAKWQLAVESKILAAPLKVLEIAARVTGLGRYSPPPIPPSLLRLMGQEIRLIPTRAQRVLGWIAKPLDQGLAETAAWFRGTARCPGAYAGGIVPPTSLVARPTGLLARPTGLLARPTGFVAPAIAIADVRARTTQRQPARRVRNSRFTLLSAGILWLMLVLLYVPGDLDFGAPAVSIYSPNPVTRVLWVTILISAASIVLRRIGSTLRLLREVNGFFLFLIGLAIASLAWSIDPELQFPRIVRLLTIFSAVLAGTVAAWHQRRFQQVIRPAVILFLFGSIAFGVLRPDLAIHQETTPEMLNAWHGLTVQKNQLGALASIGWILALHAGLSGDAKPLNAAIGWTVAATCLILSRSQTALVGAVITTLFLLLMMRPPGSMRRILPYLIVAMTALTLLYAIAILNIVPGLDYLLAPIMMVTGKEMTFSGRAEIWNLVIDHIRLRPWLGSGYGAFWTGKVPGSESFEIANALRGFYPSSAHNGYLDILNDLGIVGLVGLAGYLIVYVRQSLRLYAIDRAQGALFLAIFLLQALTNLAESEWFSPFNFDFVLMAFATTCLGRALLVARQRQPRAVAPSYEHHAPRQSPVRRPFGAGQPNWSMRTSGFSCASKRTEADQVLLPHEN
jgi:nucleoside-diphosphate-sugar epimerase/O-antigen ligase